MTTFAHTRIVFDEKEYSVDKFLSLKGVPIWVKVIQDQIVEFTSDRLEMPFQTSGSTGDPKTIFHKKKHLIASARRTLDFFELSMGSSALCMLPAQYTGGIMMLIRALVGGLTLHLIEPKLSTKRVPLVDFLPCTPAQFSWMLENQILLGFEGTILLGGAPSQKNLNVGRLKVYEGYGMTETASHVALKSYGEEEFRAVEGVHFALANESLLITAPHLGLNQLKTNDAAELTGDTSFKLLGRLDDVINSGGIKMHPSKIEGELHNLGLKDICISSKENKQLGEQLVFVHTVPFKALEASNAIAQLPRVQRPKWRFPIENMPVLPSGKLDRKELRRLIREFPHLLSPL